MWRQVSLPEIPHLFVVSSPVCFRPFHTLVITLCAASPQDLCLSESLSVAALVLICLCICVSLWRTVRYGWRTTMRFAQDVRPCHLCGEDAQDKQQHYMACGFTRRWMSRMHFDIQAAGAEMMEWVLQRVIEGGMVAVRVAAALDAVHSAFDARRHRSAPEPMDLCIARPKEMAGRHVVVRKAVRCMREQ